MMPRTIPVVFTLLVIATTHLRAQTSAQLDSVAIDWSAGHYPAALERLERLLSGPDAAQALAPAALLTGELFVTDSLAPDGRAPRWSPDGRYAAFETGTGAAVRTVILDFTRPKRRAVTVAGRNLVFSPKGTEAAYLTVDETPAMAALRAQMDSAVRLQDAARFGRARAEFTRLESETATIRLRDLRRGREREVRAPGLTRRAISWAADGRTLYLIGGPVSDPARANVYALAASAAPSTVLEAPGPRANLHAGPDGRFLVYTEPAGLIVRDLTGDSSRTFPARAYATSRDGWAIAFVQRDSGEYTLTVLRLAPGALPVMLTRGSRPMDHPRFSPDGARIIYQMMPREDWELYLIGADGKGGRRLTREIQHDLFPRFLGNDRVLAVLGEARHRRSYLHDLTTGERTRLFHNNSVRTVSAENEWAESPDGTKVLIVAERDGNTISPERSVYLTDLSRQVTAAEVLARIRAGLAAERELRERGARMFAPIEAPVRAAVAAVSVERIYAYERDLFAFDSKYITQPGNAKAIEFLAARLREFGYQPELQWFEPQPGVRTANVIARLAGTADPALVYVVSSHFDSVEEGPGSDDNTSGTSALLEAARVLAARPQRATIEFAFFTGEEAGLFGSREYVRRAVADGKRIVGALNNDMIGYANDARLDNTIRYSNDGLRDLQHAAAFLFTDLVTYDARYYKNTDAHAYYEQYGDIVGGIGSYPILGNPHYHQSHDVLETINHRLVAEVSRTTVASIMAMASAPSRLKGLSVTAGPEGAVATWEPAVERGVTGYVVEHGARRMVVTGPRAVLRGAGAGTTVAVKATGTGGMEGWDWVRATMK